jgi:RNA polymerase sigma-70 factor (ECF subfamily)
VEFTEVERELRELLQRCFARQPRAWDDFVGRFTGLVVHVARHTAAARSLTLTTEDLEDLVSDTFVVLLERDFVVLRRFRGQSSLASYLTVICRRVVVRELIKRQRGGGVSDRAAVKAAERRVLSAEERIHDRDEVEWLLRQLQGPEADVVRMYHLEGKSYREISRSVGMPENSIGPTLSRARARIRRAP